MNRRLVLFGWQGAALVTAVLLVTAGHPVLALATLFPAHMALLWAVLVPGSCWLGPVTRTLPAGPGDRVVWLTIDDGPCPDETPLLLDLLDRAGASATFFLVGERAARHPDLVREIHRRGHEIGNHTWSHPAATFWCSTARRTGREIGRTQDLLADLTGRRPVRFRAPVGMKPPGLHPVLTHYQLELIGWSARGFDGVRASVVGVVRRLVRQLHPGAVLVIHEGHGHGPGLLGTLLRELGELGYRCVLPGAGDFSPPAAGRRKTAR